VGATAGEAVEQPVPSIVNVAEPVLLPTSSSGRGGGRSNKSRRGRAAMTRGRGSRVARGRVRWTEPLVKLAEGGDVQRPLSDSSMTHDMEEEEASSSGMNNV
jgi:hypothetical protein